MKLLRSFRIIFLALAVFIFLSACGQQEQVIVQPSTRAPSSETVSRVPIVMFHYVRHVDRKTDPLGYDLSVEADEFEEILKYLASKNFHTIHVEDLLSRPVPAQSIILTFDDGYKDFYTTALPILKKYNFTASAAIITGKMDGVQYMTPENIKEIDAAGIEILSHTVNHTDLDKDPHQFREITASKKYLEKLLHRAHYPGKKIIGFVYPFGRYNGQTLQFLKTVGYRAALTEIEGFADLRGSLFELHRIRIDNRDGLEGFMKKLED